MVIMDTFDSVVLMEVIDTRKIPFNLHSRVAPIADSMLVTAITALPYASC
jgi:hypothetical protein